MYYSSRWSPGVLTLTAFALVALFVAGIPWMTIGLAAYLVAFAIPNSYELRTETLVVRSGLLRRKIPYADMVGVEREDRFGWDDSEMVLLLIETTRGRVFRVSPKDHAGFLGQLLHRAPHLESRAADPEKCGTL